MAAKRHLMAAKLQNHNVSRHCELVATNPEDEVQKQTTSSFKSYLPDMDPLALDDDEVTAMT